MTTMVTTLRAALADRRAASATEYAMLLGIMAVGLIPAFHALLTKLSAAFNGFAF